MKKETEINRLLSFLKEEFPSTEAHAELLWISKRSLPISMIGKHGVSMKVWYHHARRTLSQVENKWNV